MTRTRFLKTAGVSAFAAIILVAMLNNSKRVRARGDDGGYDPALDGASRSLLFA